MFFYAGICTVCNTGLDGDRYTHHPREECVQFRRVREALKIPMSTRLDQLDMQEVLKYEKEHGKLPELRTSEPAS